MARGMWLVAAGLAVTAAVGGSAAMHASASAPVRPAPAQAQVVTAAHTVAGQRTLQQWWVSGGHRQYERAASDLNQLIITDVVNDNDGTWIADSKRLVADATAAGRNLPPVDGSVYHAAMAELAQAGRDSLNNSFDQAYAQVKVALPKLAAFNNVVSAGLSGAPRSV